MTKTVHDLIGLELAAVSFVRDYVEFHFDGPVLRAIEHPSIVTSKAGEFLFPHGGSRDALCAAIGASVTAVESDDEYALAMKLSNGSRVTIRIDTPREGYVEAMHSSTGRDLPLQVW